MDRPKDEPIQLLADGDPRLTPAASAELARIIRSVLAAKPNAMTQTKRSA